MSEIRINILDKDRGVCGEVHGSIGDAIMAALSAEPETIDELSFAFTRFRAHDDDYSPFNYFSPHTNFEPYDAGIVVIDLAGRTIGYESTYSYPEREGTIWLRIDNSDEGLPIRFRLPEDWMFVKSIPLFEGTSAQRRKERLANPPADYRAVLYGKPMIEFIIGEIGANLDSTDEDLFTGIHAKWVMTPRDDLGAKRRVRYCSKSANLSILTFPHVNTSGRLRASVRRPCWRNSRHINLQALAPTRSLPITISSGICLKRDGIDAKMASI